MNKMIDLGSIGGKLPVYISKPESETKGGIILIHEVWGLTNHIKNIADRFAKEGYFVVAPDLLGDLGISEPMVAKLQNELFDPLKRSQAQPQLRSLMAPIQTPEFAVKTIKSLKQCFDYLYAHAAVGKALAVVGYCFGGSYSFSLAMYEPRLKAAVPYYGHADLSVDDLRKIKCPVLAFYGEKDERLVSGLPELKSNMKKAGIDFSAIVYPDCGHAFFNDTNPFAYNAVAAKSAMTKTLRFLEANLKDR